MRQFGRALGATTDIHELCGDCGRAIAAVLSDETVTVCPLGRWLPATSQICTDARSGLADRNGMWQSLVIQE
jgi:hypothetical protein